jgi:hypothetical protein
MATDTDAHLPPTDLTTLTWGGVELGWVGLRGCGGFSKPFWNISQHQPLFLFYFILFYFMFSLKHFIQIKLIHQ